MTGLSHFVQISPNNNGVFNNPREHLGISLKTLQSLVENRNDLAIPRGLSRQERRAFVRANATYRTR